MMHRELKLAHQLIDFIYDSPSAFHVVDNASLILEKAGFENWNSPLSGI
jgi:aspartyl aminopeptidase